MAPVFSLVSGVRVEPIAGSWVAFSPASGKTSFLNDESASILEFIGTGPADSCVIADHLSRVTGLSVEDLTRLIEPHWKSLVDAGLIRNGSADDSGAA